MKQILYKTNINCGGCIETVTPYLEQVEGLDNWKVDTADPDKVLTVEGHAVRDEDVRKAVEEAGYRIEKKKGGFLRGLFRGK